MPTICCRYFFFRLLLEIQTMTLVCISSHFYILSFFLSFVYIITTESMRQKHHLESFHRLFPLMLPGVDDFALTVDKNTRNTITQNQEREKKKLNYRYRWKSRGVENVWCSVSIFGCNLTLVDVDCAYLIIMLRVQCFGQHKMNCSSRNSTSTLQYIHGHFDFFLLLTSSLAV